MWSCRPGRPTQVIGEENRADELAHLLNGQSRCRPTADVVLDLAQGPDIGPGWINANVYGRQC